MAPTGEKGTGETMHKQPTTEQVRAIATEQTEMLDDIRSIIEGLPEGYDLYAAVGALVSIVEVLDR